MSLDIRPCELPILLLYNLEPSWTYFEREEVISVSTQLAQAISSVGHPTTLVPLLNEDIGAVLGSYEPSAHIVFNWCESIPGIAHSEWMVAQSLELQKFVFTGASSAALALCGDKCRVKEILEQSGIPTPAWRLYDRPRADGWNKFPAMVKPVKEHCSLGITRESVVMTEAELTGRIARLVEIYRQPVLVEDFIDGREFHVSIWGNGQIEMLPPAEMDFSLFSEVRDRLCTYESKFVAGSAHYEGVEILMPAPLGKEGLAAIERVSKAAYTATGCRDYARIDLRSRDGVFYVLDVNPNADISPDASLAWAAETAGYSYGETGSRIIQLAAKRHPVWRKRSPGGSQRVL
jgi:D-alanine-D-alanine ligase